MPNGDKITKLSDVVSILPAHPFRGSIEEVADGQARAVQMKDIEGTGAVAWHSLVRTELAGRREPNWLQPQDILFLVRGSRNIAVFLDSVPFPAVISPHFLLLRVAPGAGVLPAFVAWQMNQLPAQRYFEASAEGSVQRSIRKAVLADLPLVVPPQSTQQAIVRLAAAARQEAETYRKLIANREQELRAVASFLLKSYLNTEDVDEHPNT